MPRSIATATWSEHVVDSLAPSVAERLADSCSVLAVPAFASAAECEALLSDATAVAEQALCSRLLLRALDLVEGALPDATDELFGSGFVAALHTSAEPLGATCSRLNLTHNEPAINVYGVGGEFSPHKDLQSLTVLVPLVGAVEAYDGGGTAFWPRRLPAAEASEVAPTLVLRPPAGTALLFGGELTHAGLPVTAGHRAVFVASFSRKCATDACGGGEHTLAGHGGGAAKTAPSMEEEHGARRGLEQALLEQLYGPAG